MGEEMRESKQTEDLILYSKKLTIETAKRLWDIENGLCSDFQYNRIDGMGSYSRHFLTVSSMPFVLGYDRPKIDLHEVWSVICTARKTLLPRKVIPSGNLSARYMVIGDMPVYGGPDMIRAWQPSNQPAIWLRKAMCKLNLHWYTWYSDLVKCQPEDVRDSTPREVQEFSYCIACEIEALKPELVILVGNHAYNQFREVFNYKVNAIEVFHPNRFLTQCKSFDEYLAHLKERIG